jgi:diguanylate cyclase (GGDEF)-like protein
MAKAKRLDYKLAICAIDLDGFKPVNDEFGHEVGDHVLVEIANRLREVLRGEDTAARWGGDEFTLLLNDVSEEPDRISVTLRRIQDAISLPIVLAEGHDVRLSCSIGITLYPDDDQDADTLLRHADQAMYQAKQNGKNQYTFFDPVQDKTIHTQTRNLVSLMQAIDNDELRLLYQPQINMRDGSLYGVEALLRWQHPDQGLLGPAAFLPPPDNQNANIKLDNWVLNSALKQLHQWQQQGLVSKVSVNLSASSLQDPMFYSRLCEMLELYPEAAGQLQLEVLESTSMNDIAKVAKVIENCRQAGVSFALDDFGTGYSSLTYLRRLPADTIKIDRSFVIDMLEDENDLIIVNGILKLADAFSKEVVAEGVETVEQGQRLLEMGGALVQGYGIARPMPAEEVEQWYQNYRLPLQWQSPQRKTEPY